METEQLIRKQFIHEIIRRDAAFIYETQASVIRENFTNERAQALATFLLSRPFSIEGRGLQTSYSFSIFPYLRFLDILYSHQNTKARSRLALYNRVVWGRLYHETLPDLRYGLTEDIKQRITNMLKKSSPKIAE